MCLSLSAIMRWNSARLSVVPLCARSIYSPITIPEQEQSILILRLILDLTDSEIGEALGLSRSAVQRRRTKSLNVLRTKLTVRKGG